MQDERGEALSYGVILAGVFIAGAGIVISLLLIPFNVSFIPVFNSLISNNLPSQQTADAFSFYRNVSVAIPLFVLIGVLLWSWIKGLESRV